MKEIVRNFLTFNWVSNLLFILCFFIVNAKINFWHFVLNILYYRYKFKNVYRNFKTRFIQKFHWLWKVFINKIGRYVNFVGEIWSLKFDATLAARIPTPFIRHPVTWLQTGRHFNGVHMYATASVSISWRRRSSWSPRRPGCDSSEIRLRLNWIPTTSNLELPRRDR